MSIKMAYHMRWLVLKMISGVGGWLTAPDGPTAWGYCRIKEATQDSYCKPDPKWPCVPRKKYYGRGPMQLK